MELDALATSPLEISLAPYSFERRFEIKAVAPNSQTGVIAERLISYGFNFVYPSRLVSSIYFDTATLSDFTLSEEGIVSRSKVRLRSYPETSATVFRLEVKRTQAFVRSKYSSGVLPEGSYGRALNKGVNLGGKLRRAIIRIEYLRYYMAIGDLRVTLDTDIQFSQDFLDLPNSSVMSNTIIEIKTADRSKAYEVLSALGLVERRMSKYCAGIFSLGLAPL